MKNTDDLIGLILSIDIVAPILNTCKWYMFTGNQQTQKSLNPINKIHNLQMKSL